jgi:two-component system LytT family sensor kinase
MTVVQKRLRIEIAAATAFWMFVTLLFIAQMLWFASRPGAQVNIPDVMAWQCTFYMTWIPLTVLVWRVTSPWMPGTLGWPVFLVRHLALAAAVAVVHVVAAIFIATVVLGASGGTFAEMFGNQMRGRSYIEALIYAGVAASGQAMFLYDRWRERETQAARLESELAASRLAALQQQMQPHFLFNSLHAIASLARDGRNADVVQMIANLSDLLRSMANQSAATQPLAAEIELARRYLEIHEVRFGKRLKFEFDVAPETLALHVPALTLQPLVDNAIRHGITPAVSGGTIRVHAALHNDLLQLRVDDEGVGVPAGWSLASTAGTGISNLKSRLGILYGHRASVTASPSPQRGFSVVVTMPASASAPAA